MMLVQFEIGVPVTAMICLLLTSLTCILFPQRVNSMLDIALDRIAATGTPDA
jgi:hypothetical protein